MSSPKANLIEILTLDVLSNKISKSLICQCVKLLRRFSINSINSLEFKLKSKILIYFEKSLFRLLLTQSSYK
jgi:hypothetical protein